MATPPKFIDHYINQLISDDCVIELQKLAGDYVTETKSIDVPERHVGDREYQNKKGRESDYSVRLELKRLEQRYKDEAKKIADKFAEREGVEVEEWKDPEIDQEQSTEQEETLDEKKARIKREILTELAERDEKDKKQELAQNFQENKVEITDKASLREQIERELRERNQREKERDR